MGISHGQAWRERTGIGESSVYLTQAELAGLITLFQRNSEDAYRGRVFGAVSALEGVTVLAGTLGAGNLSRFAGIIPVLAVQGGGYVVAGLAMLVWLKEKTGEPVASSTEAQGEPTLVAADG